MGNQVTRYPNGVTTVGDAHIFADFKAPDPTQYHLVFEDFDYFAAADWVVTETQAGATQALTAGDGGLLLLTNSAADNDLVAMQKTPAAFSFTAGKKTFFKCRFKVSDATQSDVVIGLQVIDTTPLDVTDGIYFLKADGAATLDVIVRKDASTGSTSASAVASLVSDTYITLAFAYDGVDKVVYTVNDTVAGSLSGAAAYLPDGVCSLSFAIQNGEAVAKTMTVDYLFAATER